MAELNTVAVDLALPEVGNISGTWIADIREQQAAWEMYVELVTRIAVVELRPDEGLLREALSSLYTLFAETRRILHEFGPDVAQPKGESDVSFGYLSVMVLNTVLRPVLAKWHPLLTDYESMRDGQTPPMEYEKSWDRYEELRRVLNEDVRSYLADFAKLLADAARVQSVVMDRQA
jgi:hypothetical protein